MKRCCTCGQDKPLAEYHRNRDREDGHTETCKACACERARRWQQEHPEQARLRATKWREENREQYRERLRQWREEHPDRRATGQREYRRRYPEKGRARQRLADAIRSGRIVRPSVRSACGQDGDVHGHHDDYSKPLEIRWVCSLCHGRLHSADPAVL